MSASLKARVADAFEEPACGKNQAKSTSQRKAGCSKPLTPGAAAGGCAFDGAKIALQPITDAVHLVHGPLACEGNGWDSRHAASSGPSLYRRGFTTDLSELDIVMGHGEKRLYQAIKEAIRRHQPPAVFVYVTCVTALIGDDVEAVCRAATERLATPVIPVVAPGFVGSKNLGNKLAGQVLLDHVIGTVEPDDAGPCDLNIIGEYNIAGELWQVLPLLDRLGIRVRASITGDARYRDVATAHRARVSLVVCSTALVSLARGLEERWGVRWLEGSFYGIAETSRTLRGVARLLVETGADPSIIERTEALILEEEAAARSRLELLRPSLTGKRVLLYTGGVKSWSVVSALQEVGMTIVKTSVRKSTAEDKGRVVELMGTDEHMVDAIAPRDMHAMLASGQADLLMSGGRTQFIALKARVPWVDINQERHHAFAGYAGTVALLEHIHAELSSPVWAEVRRPPPWELATTEPAAPIRGLGLAQTGVES